MHRPHGHCAAIQLADHVGNELAELMFAVQMYCMRQCDTYGRIPELDAEHQAVPLRIHLFLHFPPRGGTGFAGRSQGRGSRVLCY